MARINGELGGFQPPVFVPAPPPKRRKLPESDRECPCCNTVETMSASKRMRIEERRDGDDADLCEKCWRLYSAPMGRIIWDDWQTAQRKIEEARRYEWVLCLTSQTFGGSNGAALTIEVGDVYKVARTGGRYDSTASNTIDISLGGVSITLWPHEFSPLSMTQILLMVGDGEMTNAFITDTDDTGYWCPTEEVRQQISDMYGAGRADGIGAGYFTLRERGPRKRRR